MSDPPNLPESSPSHSTNQDFEQPRLHTLGDDAAPPGLGDDLRVVLELPPALQGQLWELIEPQLGDALQDGVESYIAQLAHQHQVRQALLVQLGRSCRFLFRRAAVAGVSAERFSRDLEALCGHGSAVVQLLLPLYKKALPLLRRSMVFGSVADHGKLVTGVDWRLDKIVASQRTDKVDASVAVLTLRYRIGERDKRITLQLLPDMVEQLHEATSRILSS